MPADARTHTHLTLPARLSAQCCSPQRCSPQRPPSLTAGPALRSLGLQAQGLCPPAGGPTATGGTSSPAPRADGCPSPRPWGVGRLWSRPHTGEQASPGMGPARLRRGHFRPAAGLESTSDSSSSFPPPPPWGLFLGNGTTALQNQPWVLRVTLTPYPNQLACPTHSSRMGRPALGPQPPWCPIGPTPTPKAFPAPCAPARLTASSPPHGALSSPPSSHNSCCLEFHKTPPTGS